jgi:hypothetical protein
LRSVTVAAVRFSFYAFVIIASGTAMLAIHAQSTDQVKPQPFLSSSAKSSDSSDQSPTPKPKKPKPKSKDEASPTAKPKPKPSETPEPTATPKPKAKLHKPKIENDDAKPSATPRETPEPTESPKSKAKTHKLKSTTAKAKEDEEETQSSAKQRETPEPSAKKKSVSKKEATSKIKKKGAKSPSPKPSETPEARETPAPPRAIPVSSPTAPPAPSPSAGRARSDFRSTTRLAAPTQEPEQLTIEKYGYEKPRGFWSRLFGGGGRSTGSTGSGAGYRYLTASVRNQIDRAPVTQGRWQYIVVHNSGTRQGNAAAFDYYHRHFRRMQNGLAYHFVIGNGTSTGNGQIEIGNRWTRQINGGHVHSDYLNNIALGICLVGDFNRDQPTRAQLDCCEELIRYLRQRCGKIGNHYAIVKPHREMNPPRWATDCPGNLFPYSWFRRFQE